MKVFKVWVDKCDYDTYDSFVCVANSEDEIRNCISVDRYNRRVVDMSGNEAYENYVTFDDFQGEIHIEEVNLNVDKPYLIEQDMYGEDMTLSKEQVSELIKFIDRNPELYMARDIYRMVETARVHDDAIIINADW